MEATTAAHRLGDWLQVDDSLGHLGSRSLGGLHDLRGQGGLGWFHQVDGPLYGVLGTTRATHTRSFARNSRVGCQWRAIAQRQQT